MNIAIVLSILIGIIIVIIAMMVFGIYNSLVRLQANIKKAWANIDVIFKQRYDEIPQLIQICEQYASYEAGMIENIMQARERMVNGKNKEEQIEAAKVFNLGVKGLLAVGESYPELKANEHFMQIQKRLSHLEDHLADRREFYNDSVTIYNIRIQQVPDVLIAKVLHYEQEKLFKVDEKEKVVPNLKMNLPHAK